jgi:hypothetical protein
MKRQLSEFQVHWDLPVKRRNAIVDKVLVYKATGKRILYSQKWRVNFYGLIGTFPTFEQAIICCIAQVAKTQVERKNWQLRLKQIQENSNRIKV